MRRSGNNHHVVIIGGGFGGLYAAKTLAAHSSKNTPVHITLIDKRNFIFQQPYRLKRKLPWLSSG